MVDNVARWKEIIDSTRRKTKLEIRGGRTVLRLARGGSADARHEVEGHTASARGGRREDKWITEIPTYCTNLLRITGPIGGGTQVWLRAVLSAGIHATGALSAAHTFVQNVSDDTVGSHKLRRFDGTAWSKKSELMSLCTRWKRWDGVERKETER